MDGPPAPEEDFSSLPILDRLSHKNWKARVNGYEALGKIFSTTASDADPAFKPYISNLDLLKKMATDSNAVAQEKAIECLVAFVKFAGENAARTRESVVPALVEKSLGSARAGTRNNAIELCLQYVEVENSGVGVIADVVQGLSAKQPKAVAGSVMVLKEVIRLFGIHAAPPPPILKCLPKIFSHSDKTVRAEGTNLVLNLFQYMGGSGLEPWLADLKPVQIKDLKEAFEGMEKDGKGKGTLKPERMTRAHASEVESGAEVQEDDEEAVADLDPQSFAEAVDIISKIPASFHTALKSTKWKDRKEALDDFATLLSSSPKIADSPQWGEVAKALALRIQSDSNIQCVMAAASCLESLAKGVGTSFGRHREGLVLPLLERLKERKATVTDAIGNALDAIFSSTTMPEIIPDLETGFGSKNPQVKENTLKFLGRCLASTKTPVQTGQIKPLAETLSGLLEDGFEGARNEAATCLGTLMKMVGERPLTAVMDSLADVRKVKVKEAYDKATVKCKAGAGGPAPKVAPSKAEVKKEPAPRAAKKVPASKAAQVEEDKPPKKAAAKPAARPTKAAGGAAPVAKKSAPAPKPGKQAPMQSNSLDAFKYVHVPEAAEALAAEMIPQNIVTELGDSNWKTRLSALDAMIGWVQENIDTLDTEVVFRLLGKKGWSEKNFQVSAKLFGILQSIAEQSPSFSRSCVALSAPHISEKLGDLKLKKPAGEALAAFAETTSLQFVLSQVYDSLSKQKAPKVLSDAVSWINSALIDFGIGGLSLRALVEFLKSALGNSTASVRASATKAMVTVKLFAGPSIRDLIQDLNPQLLATISSEFDKVEGQSPPEPTRYSADLADVDTTVPGASSGQGDPLGDLFPRVDIDSLLKGTTILVSIKSDNWKTKKEGLETFQGILDQGENKRLKPNLGEIGGLLKARVTDTNKAVQGLALDIVARLATGMGKPFEKQTKIFVLSVATVLSDQKAPIRQSALTTLSAIATACEGLDSLVPSLASALETTNPLQKGVLLQWLNSWFKNHELTTSLNLGPWAGLIVSSLDDRNSDVRKGAQELLPILITTSSFEHVMQQISSLKPASRNTAIPLVQAARDVASASGKKPEALPSKPIPAPVARKVATPSPDEVIEPEAVISAPKMSSKLGGVRRPLPVASSSTDSSESGTAPRLPSKAGPKRPLSKPTPKVDDLPAPTSNLIFHSNDLDSRPNRFGRDSQKWINEGGPARKDLVDFLLHQMEPHSSKNLLALLFSQNHNTVNDNVSGLSLLYDFYVSAKDDASLEPIALAHFDLPLKYVSIKIHESQPNLVSRCVDVADSVINFLQHMQYQLTDSEATCFIPTLIYKLGDAREQVRMRVQGLIQGLSKVYAYSRLFQLLLDHGLKAKVAKARQGALEEMTGLIKRSGISTCEPAKAFPPIAVMISDKDPAVRKSALGVLSEAFTLVGDKIWSFVGPLSPKDKTQLEERLRRVSGPSSADPEPSTIPSQLARRAAGIPRSASPSVFGRGGIPRPASPLVSGSRLARPASPAKTPPTSSHVLPPTSPVRNDTAIPSHAGSSIPARSGFGRPKTMLPSKHGKPRNYAAHNTNTNGNVDDKPVSRMMPRNGLGHGDPEKENRGKPLPDFASPDDITVIISGILSSDSTRSVDALKKIQKTLSLGSDAGSSSMQYQALADHTEGLIETITLQMAHVFENSSDLLLDPNFRLAKHLLQTLNNFGDHPLLVESLSVDILTSLLEELTMRLLETDESHIKKIKDLSRFVNMIILRLFATGRRMSIFRSLFALLLQIVKPFPTNGTPAESKEAKVAELVLKCIWKLARNIPQDLSENLLDPVELFPAIEHLLQSVPPNEWRARAANKIPCGDMPLRTVKVIIQHVVAHYGDDVYDLLSASFDDPSATIVYPYVYRILNVESQPQNGTAPQTGTHSLSPVSSRPTSPQDSASSAHSHRQSSASRRTSPSVSSVHEDSTPSPSATEPDPDSQLLAIIGHISSETTGALHKEGITELHHFLKAYPHKRQRVETMLDATGAAFRKYINRALATRQAEDKERNIAFADTLSKLEANTGDSPPPDVDTTPHRISSPRQSVEAQEKLSRLHDIFQYRSSTASTDSTSPGRNSGAQAR